MSARKSMLVVLLMGLVWWGADQGTKYVAVAELTTLFPADASFAERVRLFYGTDGLYPMQRPARPFIEPVWSHVYVQNPAGAFGLLRQAPLGVRRAIFTGVAALAAFGILWMAARSRSRSVHGKLTRLSLALVLGGALGNLTDRVVHGYVIDFIDWHWKDFHWPAFNVADIGIVVGVFALVLFLNRAPAPAGEVAPTAEAAVATEGTES